jgi:hypothetical protein
MQTFENVKAIDFNFLNLYGLYCSKSMNLPSLINLGRNIEILTHNFKLMKKWETALYVFSSNIKLFVFDANRSLK